MIFLANLAFHTARINRISVTVKQIRLVHHGKFMTFIAFYAKINWTEKQERIYLPNDTINGTIAKIKPRQRNRK